MTIIALDEAGRLSVNGVDIADIRRISSRVHRVDLLVQHPQLGMGVFCSAEHARNYAVLAAATMPREA